MATANDVFQEVLFNDGEGIDPDDFNSLQRTLRALVLDTLVACGIGNGVQDPDGSIGDVLEPDVSEWVVDGGDLTPLDCAFTPYPGSGMLLPVGANNLTVSRGVFVQVLTDLLSGADGNTPTIGYF